MNAKEKQILRDYSLVGVEAKRAVELGLADAEWYQTPIPKDQMRALLVRKNGPAIRDSIIWFGLLLGSGYLVYLWWGTWYAILPYVVYSVLYASSSDSRWHESSHGTAFKTDWMNNVLYEISSFMVFRQSTVWKWSHARHHSDTIIRGRDPEISIPRPTQIKTLILTFFGISAAVPEMKKLLKHASGKIDVEVATYVPKSEYKKVIFKARIYVLIFLSVIVLSIVYNTILPLMFIGLPTLFGTWLMPFYGFTQHAGLDENVLDHRLNSRTVLMNRVHRFLYWNMNYHVEHHMFPLVPYHALPKLHELMKYDCPKPNTSIYDAFKEILPAILKQQKDPTYFIKKELPATAHKSKSIQKAKIVGKVDKVINGKIEVCSVDKIIKGEAVRFDFRDKTYAIYRTNDDQFYATDGMCTHGNAHLGDGVVIGETIECPKHNGRFNLKDGSPKRLPVCVGLKTYTTYVENQSLYLDVSDVANAKDDEMFSFKVISNKNVATFIKELELEPLKTDVFEYVPGQYIQLEIPPYKINFDEFIVEEPFNSTWEANKLMNCSAENSFHVKRNYSMATNPKKDKTLKFNIRIALPPANKAVSAGIGSSYVFNLKAGDEVKISKPYGDFHIKTSEREMVYIGGGAGMAPLKSHLSYLLETQKTDRKISFWYGARSKSELFYHEYFEQLQKKNENFNFNIALSEPDETDLWDGYIGFIHEVLLEKYLKNIHHQKEIEYYLCGPPAMIQASLKMLRSINVPEELIAFDEF
ncbi:NADH:ubiquinone reductase (Na(+)-transporting) subunit F [Wenyingzhuangia sp. chi5]|uniref:NADH:ubiquinone reductase (Na(+)-transporting) subunit F n=1 Tax=Wenyingzhuangia gilva TaxID=3057677 RepID=A0ABT8VTP4_9FLAO|nr:NADH:ubiquinone reductase (Na(+)-transporting) subunit F [Wenyingzhuangia sp. chi5]MDO3695312.1 NADH:ubiquinone reductase (Na(+)-transporting) subunit F [Wenyingzhuangia sp. chi5]